MAQWILRFFVIVSILLPFACASQESPGFPGDSLSLGQVHYRVQVGAFKNGSSYPGFTMVQYEMHEGVRKQTVGYFITREGATAGREALRNMGYADAFIVAYKNGVRIPIEEVCETAYYIKDDIPAGKEIEEIEIPCEDSVLRDSISGLMMSLKTAKMIMLKEHLRKIAILKVVVGETVLVGAVILGITTGAWVPVMMGAAVIEIYLLLEGNYRLNTRELRRVRRKGM